MTFINGTILDVPYYMSPHVRHEIDSHGVLAYSASTSECFEVYTIYLRPNAKTIWVPFGHSKPPVELASEPMPAGCAEQSLFEPPYPAPHRQAHRHGIVRRRWPATRGSSCTCAAASRSASGPTRAMRCWPAGTSSPCPSRSCRPRPSGPTQGGRGRSASPPGRSALCFHVPRRWGRARGIRARHDALQRPAVMLRTDCQAWRSAEATPPGGYSTRERSGRVTRAQRAAAVRCDQTPPQRQIARVRTA